MKNFTDEKLIQAYLMGDEKALEELIRRYLPLIYNFSRRYSGDADNASDIAQEVFVKVWKNLKKPALSLSKGFDPKKGNFKSWVFTIAKNAALDWLKKKNAVPFSLLKESKEDENFEETIADLNQLPVIERIYQESLSHEMAFVIDKLQPKYGLIISLYHDSNLNFREISGILNESINTVKSRYRRGLAVLRKILSKK